MSQIYHRLVLTMVAPNGEKVNSFFEKIIANGDKALYNISITSHERAQMKRTENIAARLRAYRALNNMTLSDIEKITSIPAQTINRYELGQRAPKLDIAVQIADALNVNPLWLQGYDVPMDAEKAPASVLEDERVREFISLFSQLSESQQKMVVAQIKGILAEQ